MKARLTAGKARAGLAAAMAVLVLAACTQKAGPTTPPEPGDKAVARVNGAVIWASDVKREAVAQALIGQGEPLDTSSDLFRQVLDEVVDQKLLAAEALRRRLDKDPIAQRRLAAARERILADMLLENSVGKVVNENTINGLYQEMLKTQTPAEEIHLRQVVSATQADADQVKKALAAGASFDAVAAERSTDEASRFKGGVLPPMTSDTLPEAYAAVVKDAKPGQLLGPFKSDQGWVVARIDERRLEPPVSLEAARPQIIHFITFDQVKDVLLDLRKHAKVETLIPPPPDVPGAPREPASAPPAAASL
ncbi:MAG TPA: peptidylprolyl isomerase, partial [Caulobacteraceae bacterium]|nr:peptidylprolyl isomerase [Caulobacteraceae bacterium]